MHASVGILGHYHLVEKIGEGGMGEVYRAHDEHLERDVAIKVLPLGTLTNESSRKRFRKEALSLSKLNHPNIATIHDFDTQAGVDFLVMEYIPGMTLSEKLVQRPLTEKEVTQLGQQLAEGLAAAHEQGVVHRDLKPGNLRITADGRLKILDFGLATLLPPTCGTAMETRSETEALAGTLPYMAPEQLRGQPADARSDIWGTGTVLYEMATGQRPFNEKVATATADAILHNAPAPPGRLAHQLSPHLENIILKCLEKDPENRYQSAKDLLVELRRPVAAVPQVLRKDRPRWWLMAGLGAVVIAVVSAVIFLGFMRAGGAKPGAQRITSLAVLPLENLSHDPEQEYFADGMTEELITDLSKIEALRVISRTSVMRFKGVSRPLPEIASELNVDGVIEGSVRRAGDRVRISAQLVGAVPERHLWAGNYEGELRDILALQSHVAQEISREVNVTLTQQDRQRLATTRTVKPEAYEAYLKGVHYLDQANGPEAEKKAAAYLQEAIAKDPSYAPAYVGLAFFYMLSASGVQAPGESLPKAKLAALKALEIDSSLAEAHAALARAVLIYDHDWRAAETGLRRALELNPASARVHYWLGYMLLPLGRSTEAVSEIQRAYELDPLSLDSNLTLGLTFFLAGQYDRAIEQYRKTLELDPHVGWTHVYLSWAYQQKGMHAEAIAEVRKALAESSNNTQWLANLALAYALAGRRADARNVMAELDRLSQREYVSSYDRAMVLAALGEKEAAFAALEKALEEHSERIVWLKVDWRFETLHSDPRFQGLLQRIGLPN